MVGPEALGLAARRGRTASSRIGLGVYPPQTLLSLNYCCGSKSNTFADLDSYHELKSGADFPDGILIPCFKFVLMALRAYYLFRFLDFGEGIELLRAAFPLPQLSTQKTADLVVKHLTNCTRSRKSRLRKQLDNSFET